MSPAGAGRIVLHAVGDIGFGGALRPLTAPDGAADPFAGVAGILSGADLLFGNLETPLVEAGTPPASRSTAPGFGGDPRCARWLARSSFTIVSLANNHVMDYGLAGLESTTGALRAAGVLHVGAGPTLGESRRPVIVERAGLRVGFLAYAAPGRHSATDDSPGAAPLLPDLVREDVRRLRPLVDLVVLSLHFGLIYSDFPRREDQALARELCDLGAGIILGHHPHVLQGIEKRGGSLIAYSLGEILFDPASGYVVNRSAAEVRRESIALRVVWEAGGVVACEPRPTSREGLTPAAVTGERGRTILNRLDGISAPLEGDGLLSIDAGRSASMRTVGHQWDVFRHHLARGHWGLLAGWLLRLRPRHLKVAIVAFLSHSRRNPDRVEKGRTMEATAEANRRKNAGGA